MEAWLGLVGAIAGVTLAWGLNQATKIIADRRKSSRELVAAAFVCLDRLLKIESAANHSDSERRNNEIHLLGSDLDRYRDCIAASPTKMRRQHWRMYRDAVRILEHDLTNLSQVISDLESISGSGTPSSGGPKRPT